MKRTFLPFVLSLLLSFVFTFSQAQVNLGLASPYAFFTTAGAVNNIGSTTINGDIGTNVGAFDATGLTISGATHVQDIMSSSVATDVNAAYTTLQGTPCPNSIGVGLGGGQTLTPGVYCTGAAATLDSTLTLDAGNDPTAIFIIKVGGALSTGIASRVMLINGATAANVYWVVAGQTNLGGSSVFQGNIVSSGGSLNLASGAILVGQGLVVNGAINLNNNLAGIGTVIPLPVTLLGFSANAVGNTTSLSWTTGNEQNVQGFEVQRSTNAAANSWTTIAIVTAKGNTKTESKYTSTDNRPEVGSNYYRLKMIDLSGDYKYSETRQVTIKSTEGSVVVAPNPMTSTCTINTPEGALLGSTCIITDITGRTYSQVSLTAKTTVQTDSWPAGVYFVRFANGQTLRLLKQAL